MGTRFLIGAAGVLVFSIALLALVGHLSHHVGWFWWRGEEDGMALNTSICLIAIGAVMLWRAIKYDA